ncbi:pyridoxamine 5'-phosphate oxidase family protein [Legionella fallonii]|nr:pyridoxamine 5'-phosphate oxidase family protein [Legionella fallonii]
MHIIQKNKMIHYLDLVTTVKQYLHHWFAFPKNKLFAQVSTIHEQKPCIRTMDLYDVTSKGSLIFLTDTNSPKWSHLTRNPNIGICLLHREYGQIIVEGSALLDTSVTNLSLATLYWENYLDDYWRRFYLSNSSNTTAHGIPSSFGIMHIIPKSWEILAFSTDDFLKGLRVKYQLHEGVWIKNPLPLL